MKTIIKECQALLKLIRTAARYKKRPLMLDLIGPLIVKLENEINDPLCGNVKQQIHKQAIRPLKQFTIMSAWHTKEDDKVCLRDLWTARRMRAMDLRTSWRAGHWTIHKTCG